MAIRIGERCPDGLFRRLRQPTGVLITAWNPLSRLRPEGCNRRMQRMLTERLRRYATLAADGSLGQWHEMHLLVAADPRKLHCLARIFRQCGIVILRRGRKARLQLV